MENQLSIALKNNELFKDINLDVINLEGITGTLSTIVEGQILYREGDNSDVVYFIVSGEVNLLKKRPQGKTQSFIFSENEFFGHDEFLDNINRISTVVALSDSYLIALSRSEMANLFLQDPQIKITLKSFCLQELHEEIAAVESPQEDSDVETSETQMNTTADESKEEIVFDDSMFTSSQSKKTDDEDTEEESDKAELLEEREADAFSFGQLHDQVEEHHSVESMKSDISYPDEMFAHHESDEETDTPEEEVKISEEEQIPVKIHFEDQVETQLNKELENFESPDEYEEHLDDFEYKKPKTIIDEDEIEVEKDLSFLENGEETISTTSDILEKSQHVEKPEDVFMDGISSEDELKKIDELIKSSDSETQQEIEDPLANIPAEEISNGSENDVTWETPKTEESKNFDDAQSIGEDESTFDLNSLEDDISLTIPKEEVSKTEDEIIFEEPEKLADIPEDSVEEKIEDETSQINGYISDPIPFTPIPEEESTITAETIDNSEQERVFETEEPEVFEKAVEQETEEIPILEDIEKEPVNEFDQIDEIEIDTTPVQAPETELKIEELESSTELSPPQLEMIIQAAELVNSNLKLDDLLVNIVDVAVNILKADRGTLYLVENEKNEIWSKVAMGNEIKEFHLKIGEGIAGWVAQSGEVVNIKDVQNDERFKADYDKITGYQTKSMLCFPIKNKEGIIIGVIQLLNSKDGQFSRLDEELLNAISIHAALALENAALVEKLLQAERVSSLGKMANFLIQDIKKPILVSKRYADHLYEKDLQPEIKQVLEMMTDQLNHVADLVQTTSSYSQGNTVLRTINTNVTELLTDYCNRVETFVRTKKCQITKEFAADANIKVDLKEFFQCFNHLIKNACDAMPDGGNIILKTNINENRVEISIKDNGLGIPESIKEKIFEPFMSHGKRDGTGLGLSITKKIIEHHSGTLEVESILGNGATFIVTLPLSNAF